MVFASICEYASRAFFFASKSIDKSQPCEQQTLLIRLPPRKTEHASTCKNMRPRTNEHSLKFCEHSEQKLNFASTAKFWWTPICPCRYCARSPQSFRLFPGNADCSGEDRRLRILRNCPRKKIVGVVGCPSLRACVSCGMLIEHVRACKHMHCRCGKEFCFICLKPKEGSGWKCGRYNAACDVAPVQNKIPGEE